MFLQPILPATSELPKLVSRHAILSAYKCISTIKSFTSKINKFWRSWDLRQQAFRYRKYFSIWPFSGETEKFICRLGCWDARSTKMNPWLINQRAHYGRLINSPSNEYHSKSDYPTNLSTFYIKQYTERNKMFCRL